MAKSLTFPPELVGKLQTAQRELHDILAIIQDTEECGIDCQSYRAQWQESYDQIGKMLEKFGPGKSAS